ncbi:hypothetical protein RB623_12465 [Mesorhizobium sp. LHD-90]|uniref:hypothetical protein n=1 Tax=Mesorhizobium sp. LHD-90 TaxID=3071414 RepID=UPI0027E14773|nr:hypothetical protein [Mesorhizobium sp. LHD-90]MDQ6434862.1 hypothetical protein [Mesorhizobium sp. LHD-90]
MLRLALWGLAGFAAYRIAQENGWVRERQVRLLPRPSWDREDISKRRTPGRSERPETLEEQLQEGLEDSFPASDPPSVVSTTIAGRAKKVIGTDEVLARRRASR